MKKAASKRRNRPKSSDQESQKAGGVSSTGTQNFPQNKAGWERQAGELPPAGHVLTMSEAIEQRLREGLPVSQGDWDQVVDMFDDDPDEMPLPQDVLERDAAMQMLVRDAVRALGGNKEQS